MGDFLYEGGVWKEGDGGVAAEGCGGDEKSSRTSHHGLDSSAPNSPAFRARRASMEQSLAKVSVSGAIGGVLHPCAVAARAKAAPRR